jgi:hypothetical protein
MRFLKNKKLRSPFFLEKISRKKSDFSHFLLSRRNRLMDHGNCILHHMAMGKPQDTLGQAQPSLILLKEGRHRRHWQHLRLPAVHGDDATL